MAKVTIGGSHGRSRLQLNANFLRESNLELSVGDGSDMSVREINLIERERDEIEVALAQLEQWARESEPKDAAHERLQREARKFAATAGKSVQNRKWYSLSAAGLLEAAQLIGATADPVMATAVRVIGLFASAREQSPRGH